MDKKLLVELQNYIERCQQPELFLNDPPIILRDLVSEKIRPAELEGYIKTSRKQPFNRVLFHYIDKKGASDADIYKKAGLDRRHFSKIRSNPDYRPGKATAIALALALELNKKEAEHLLRAAGYSLSDNDTFDLIIRFCLEKKIFDLHSVNEALNYFSLKPLSGALE